MASQFLSIQESLKDALKSVLKHQKKTYEDLAVELDLSLPTVKRILTKEELSLSRLLQICEFLKISLTDLEKIANHNKNSKSILFTPDQDIFLAKNPQYLTFLMMMYGGDTPEEIQKKTRIDQKSLKLYLLRLEKLDLLHYHNGKYITAQQTFPSLIPYGKLHETQFKNIVESGADFFKRYYRQRILEKNAEKDKGTTMGLTFMTLSRESYLQWFDKLKKLYAEVSDISSVEEKMPKLKNKKTVIIMACHAVLEPDDIEIEHLKKTFGAITQIES